MANVVERLKIMTGVPIPSPSLGTTIRQPTVKDVSLIGETRFLRGISLLTTTKEKYQELVENSSQFSEEQVEMVRNELLFMSDFQLVLNTANSDQELAGILKDMLLMLITGAKAITLEESFIIVGWMDPDTDVLIMTEKEFTDIVEIAPQVLVSDSIGEKEFNPANDQAAQIAAKIQARRDIVAREKGLSQEETSPIGTAVSILSTSDGIPVTEIVEYTLPQLFMQLERSGKKYDQMAQFTLGAMGGLKTSDLVNWKEPI